MPIAGVRGSPRLAAKSRAVLSSVAAGADNSVATPASSTGPLSEQRSKGVARNTVAWEAKRKAQAAKEAESRKKARMAPKAVAGSLAATRREEPYIMPPKKEPPKLVKGAAAASASLAIELSEATEENARLVAETEQLQAKLDESEPAREAAEAAAAKAEAAHAAAQERLANLEATHLKEKAEAEAREAAAKAECAALSEQLEALKQRAVAQEELRRQMAETIHEVTGCPCHHHHHCLLHHLSHLLPLQLKGNIRVFCRVRPPATEEDEAVSCIEGAAEDTALEVAGPKGGSTRFQFDHVFSGAASQGDVYDEVTHLVQSAMDGHNVCVFAYGQTGSGKTYTMDGPRGNEAPELRGVVPRAAAQVFASAKELGTLGWTFSFKASCVEVYNEELRDLLGGKGETKLKIQDSGGTVSIPGLKQVDVTDSASLQKMLDFAAKNRATTATQSNDTSSRSHLVFRLYLSGENPKTGKTTESELNLIDLAGCERVKQSGVKGIAFEEAKAINKSLSALGDVICALASRAKHKPFRNSKLTHLLANSLSGSSKTLMFVNVAPGSKHYSETVSALRFAAKVNDCVPGK